MLSSVIRCILIHQQSSVNYFCTEGNILCNLPCLVPLRVLPLGQNGWKKICEEATQLFRYWQDEKKLSVCDLRKATNRQGGSRVPGREGEDTKDLNNSQSSRTSDSPRTLPLYQKVI